MSRSYLYVEAVMPLPGMRHLGPRFRTVLGLAALAPALACHDAIEPAGPYSIEVVSTDSIPLPGAELQVVLRVLNASGDAAPGQRLSLATDDGALSTSEALSGADGLVAVAWTLPRSGGAEYGVFSGPPGRFTLSALLPGNDERHIEVRAEPLRVEQMHSHSYLGCGVRAGMVYCWPASTVAPTAAVLPDGFVPVEVRVVPLVNRAEPCTRGQDGRVVCGGWQDPAVVVTGLPPLIDLVAAGSMVCGRAADSTAWCWNQLQGANGTLRQVSTPPLLDLVGGGWFDPGHACGRAVGGTWCWGRNWYGQLGDGTTSDSESAVLVAGSHDFISLSAGEESTCGVERNWSVWCWGLNATPVAASTPTSVTLPGVQGPRIAVGASGAFALGARRAVGWSDSGLDPVDPMFSVVDVAELSSSFKEMCIRTFEGFVYCSRPIGSTYTWPPHEMIPVPRPAGE